MDPVACIERLKTAVKDQDVEEVNSSLNDLWDWLEKGGFAPPLIGPIFGFFEASQTPWSKEPWPIKSIFEITNRDFPWITMHFDPYLTTDENDPSSFVWMIRKWIGDSNYKEYKFPKP